MERGLHAETITKNGSAESRGDQCVYGLKTRDGNRIGLARKSTGFLTNAPCIAQALSKRCPNTRIHKVHDHIRLERGRTKAAQVYPPELCHAICQGLKAQLEADRKGQFLLAELEGSDGKNGKELAKTAKELQEQWKTVEDDDEEEMAVAWDDVSGATLDPNKVKAARAEELEYVRKMNLYTKVPVSECLRKIGKPPISVRWIDINKGDAINTNYRSRLVAREINTHKRDDLFAATPPLEALKIILSMTSSCNNGEVVMINDISRAFFHAKAKREVYVQLPNEDKTSSKEPMCGKFNYSMYGTRDAAQNWHEEYSQKPIENGFEQGKATPCIFFHKERAIRTYVHGDDYVSTGLPNQLTWLKNKLEEKYQVKTQILGPNENQLQEVKILNRIVSWCNETGLHYEADPRHIEIIIDQLGLQEAKPVSTPGTKEVGRTQTNHEDRLNDKETSNYRAIVARCNYIVPDRPDIAYTVKGLARSMANPRNGDWQRLKRLGRYFKGRPRLQQIFEWQRGPIPLKIYSDADWAGCRETRRSTTGGCVMLGKHTIKGWSKTQSLVALSSGESELYATLKAAAEGLGRTAMLSDLGMHVTGEFWGDANAALGIINRKGLGKTRHIDIGYLWIQDVAAKGRLKFSKIL